MRALRTLVLLALAWTARAAPLPELTLTPGHGVLRLAVTGDTGKGADAVAEGIRRLHSSSPFDGIVLTGDTFYPCGVTSEEDRRWSLVASLTGIGIPLFPVLGNHDFCGKADPDAQIRATGHIPNWKFPARQYTVRMGAADVVFLDTTPYVKGRRNSVEAALRKAFAGSTARWRVVVGHHPVISSGYHGYFPRDEVDRMRGLIPALRAAKADLYICGHDHHLELIRGRMLHLVSGAGSSPIPAIKLRVTTVFPTEIGRERRGFAVLEISEKAIRVRFHDADGRPRSEWIPGRQKAEGRKQK